VSTHRASTSSSGGFRAVAPRPPVPYQRPAEPPGAGGTAGSAGTVGEQAARQGWTSGSPNGRPTPAHTPPRGQRPVATRPGDGRALTALRVVTYVLTSLASLLFIALVVYGFLVLQHATPADVPLPRFGSGG
jgi:hypothetical protein